MNLLLDPLPDSVVVGGLEYPIRTDFRDWMLFEQLILAKDSGDDPRFQMLEWYECEPPPTLDAALLALLDFYKANRREAKEPQQKSTLKKPTPRAYDFDVDAGLIYAAFWQAYHIDLTQADMHWWKFCALMDALPHDTEFVRAMGYRVADTTGMSKQEKKHMEKMKKLYAIGGEARKMTLEERDAKMKQYVEIRLSEVG